jgi:hypothetical protein
MQSMNGNKNDHSQNGNKNDRSGNSDKTPVRVYKHKDTASPCGQSIKRLGRPRNKVARTVQVKGRLSEAENMLYKCAVSIYGKRTNFVREAVLAFSREIIAAKYRSSRVSAPARKNHSRPTAAKRHHAPGNGSPSQDRPKRGV